MKRLMIKCYINDYADISKARDYDCEKKAQFIKSSSWMLCGFEYHAYTYKQILKINKKLISFFKRC